MCQMKTNHQMLSLLCFSQNTHHKVKYQPKQITNKRYIFDAFVFSVITFQCKTHFGTVVMKLH